MFLSVTLYILIIGCFEVVGARDAKIEPVVHELRNLESHFSDFDMRIEKKLAQMERAFEKKLNSVKTFYKRKLTKIEKRLSESENEMAEVKNNYYNIEKKLRSTQKLNDIILNRVEKRLNSIEEKLDEVVDTNGNKFNDFKTIEKITCRNNEKNDSDFKSADTKFTKIEQTDAEEMKINSDSELRYNNGVSNRRGAREANGSTPEVAGYVMDETEKDALEDKDKKSENTEFASLTRRQTSSGHNRVAFTASLSNTTTGFHREHTIPFDQVLLNEGQAFDTALHVFVCPVNGIYMFQSAALSLKSDMIQTEIVKNGVELVATYAAGSSGSHGYDQGFNSAIIQCNKSERVWVRVHSHVGTAIYGAGPYTTFSGFLLWEK